MNKLLIAFIATGIAFTTNAFSVTILSPSSYEENFKKYGLHNTKGLYHRTMDRAWVKNTSDKQDKAYTVAHETCHHLWFKKTSPILRTQYVNFYREDRVSPTKYGRTNISENFAEVCAHAIMDMHQEDSRQLSVVERLLSKPLIQDIINTHTK